MWSRQKKFPPVEIFFSNLLFILHAALIIGIADEMHIQKASPVYPPSLTSEHSALFPYNQMTLNCYPLSQND